MAIITNAGIYWSKTAVLGACCQLERAPVLEYHQQIVYNKYTDIEHTVTFPFLAAAFTIPVDVGHLISEPRIYHVPIT